MKTPVKHFLDLCDIPAPELRRILDAAASIKARRRKG
jgi:ornithine carbamoyltransferase